MSLLHEIQTEVIRDNSDLGPILLKLRLLAARLGSQPLADWVKHESEGYPDEAAIPDYRVVSVSYTGTFSGAFGAGVRNASIPPYLIEKFAGSHWNKHEIRQGIAVIDELLVRSSKGSGRLHINAANLILLLQGKVYEGYACNDVSGTIPSASFAGLRHAVRSRVLELTIELERSSIPEAAAISLEKSDENQLKSSAVATQIFQQIVYGNLTAIASTGHGTQFNVSVGERDTHTLIEHLKAAGIPEADATEFAAIVSNENPESKQEPLGPNAKAWLIENLKKTASGAWKVGVSVAADVVKEAVLKYYGLK